MAITINLAQVVLGTTSPTSEGRHGAQRCIIQDSHGHQFRAILKEGSLEEVRNELFCSILLSEWGLSVPDPYLVNYNNQLAFACAEKHYPCINQRLNLGAQPSKKAVELAIDLVASLNDTPLALAIDELIENRDRNTGNILWGGGKTATWIDHSHCFSQAAIFDDKNKLAIMAQHHHASEKICRSAVAQALTLSSQAINQAKQQLLLHNIGPDVEDYNTLNDKIGHLPNKVVARFPSQQANLFG